VNKRKIAEAIFISLFFWSFMYLIDALYTSLYEFGSYLPQGNASLILISSSFIFGFFVRYSTMKKTEKMNFKTFFQLLIGLTFVILFISLPALLYGHRAVSEIVAYAFMATGTLIFVVIVLLMKKRGREYKESEYENDE